MARIKKHITSNHHVIPLGKGWAVKAENSTEFFVISYSQSDAIKVARKLAQSTGTELVIHARNGQIRDRVSYVNTSTSSIRKK